MRETRGRPFLLALMAGLGAFLAWAISQPYLPYAPLRADLPIESHFTLGTFYGWFNNVLFGAFVCGPLALFISLPRHGWSRSLLLGLLGAVLGGVLVCGGDALSDTIMIKVLHGSNSMAGEEFLALGWHLLVAGAMSFSVAVACGPTPKRLGRAVKATLTAAFASYVLRFMLLPLVALVVASRYLGSSPANLAKINTWSLFTVSELIQNVSIAMVVALTLGYIEYFAREAWVRLEVGRGEGRDYGLERIETRIGSAEGAEIGLRGDPSIAPWHAKIVQNQGAYGVLPLAGAILINGYPSAGGGLVHGDSIGVGSSTLIFLEKGKGRSVAPQGLAAYPRDLQPVVPAYVGGTAVVGHPVAGAPLAPSRPRLKLASGREFDLRAGSNLLGRDLDSLVDLTRDDKVSRRHAEIRVSGSAVSLVDLGSRNGSVLNGQLVGGEVALSEGDTIILGNTAIVVRFA